ncbi:MAG: dockerin type I domain-containing protein [Chthoniobacterales bacterium]
MKNNQSSESGLFNARLVAAISLTIIGVSLTMMSLASTPSSGTLTDVSGPQTYTAGPFFQPNAFGNSIAGECDPDPSDPLVACDIYRLHVALPPGYVQANPNQHLFVRIDWPTPAARFDLYLWDARSWSGVTSFPNGSPLASSTNTATNFQQIEIAPDAASNGDFVVQVSTTLPAGQSFTGTISLGPATSGHGTVQPAGNASGIAPRFQAFIPTDANGAPSASLGLIAGEPTIGINPKINVDKGGDLFYQALFEILRVRFDDSTSPAKATWEFKDSPTGLSNKATLDPIFLADPTTGRLWATQLSGGPALTDISDDDGETWTGGLSGTPGTGVDHQGLGVGPYPANLLPPVLHPLYPNAVYYCSQQIATAYCSRSDDGGKTYGPIVPIYDSATSKCVGLHGHPKVGADGTVYVPNKGCGLDTPVLGNGLVNMVVSENAGVSWQVRPVTDSTGSLLSKGDPSVAIDKNGRVYLAYQNLNNNHLYVTFTDDHGLHYSPSLDVGALAGINYSVFPAMAAGDGGRAAVAFFGSTYNGPNTNYEDMSFPGVWNLYIATTYDGGGTWFVNNTTPDNPIQGFGGIGNSGDNRNHYDFIDCQIDTQGRIIASNSIGCSAACVNNGGPNTFSKLAGIVRQSGGRRMIAAYDPQEPFKPAAPLLNGYRTPQNVVLNWPEPDGTGLAVTGYNVYRKIDNAAETKIASATPQRQFVDSADPAKSYTYRVTALNSQGESAFSNLFSPTVGQNAPQPQLSCSLPGQVYTDRTGEGGTEPNNDIASFSIAEPSDMPGKLVFVINNAQPNLVQNGNSLFYVYFDPPTGGVRYRLRYSADSSAPVNEIGRGQDGDFTDDPTPETGGQFRNWTVIGTLESGSGIQPDGSVRFIIDKAKLGIKTGDVLLGVAIREDAAHSPSGVLAADYAGGRQDYTVVGNDFCTIRPPVPVTLVSRRTHGTTDFDLNLLPPAAGIECRTGGTNAAFKMVVTFPLPVSLTGSPQAAVTSGTGTVSNVTVSGNQVTVDLTGVANAQRLAVRLNGVTDANGSGNVILNMGVLLGDVDGNGNVSGSDVNLVKSKVGAGVSSTTFTRDVDANGSITGSDVNVTKSKVGTSL